MKHGAPVLVTALLLSACASYNTNYVAQSSVSQAPADGRILTAEVGDTVVSQGRYTTTPAIRLESDVKVGVVGENRVHTGYYVKVGEDNRSEFYQPEIGPNGGRISKAALADPVKGLQVYKGETKLCTVSAFNFHDCRENAVFTRVDRLVLAADSRQQHLVYAGRRGNLLTFGYVESANLVSRPVADGRVVHDLSVSNVVNHKGLAIEIVEATDASVRYRIIAAPVAAG